MKASNRKMKTSNIFVLILFILFSSCQTREVNQEDTIIAEVGGKNLQY